MKIPVKIADLFSDRIITVPNLLTLVRMACVPFAWYYLKMESVTGESTYLINVLFCYLIIGFSDFMDGFLARAFNQVSRLGQFLDPIADKITVLVISSALVLYRGLPLWFFILILIREIGVISAAVVLYFQRDIAVKPNVFGKTALAITGVLFLLYSFNPWIPSEFSVFKRPMLYIIVIFHSIGLLESLKTYTGLYAETER